MLMSRSETWTVPVLFSEKKRGRDTRQVNNWWEKKNRTHIWRSRSSSSKFVRFLSFFLQSGSERAVLGSFVLHLSLRLSLFPEKERCSLVSKSTTKTFLEKPQHMSKPSKILQGMQICSQVKQTGRPNCRKQQFLSCRKYSISRIVRILQRMRFVR